MRGKYSYFSVLPVILVGAGTLLLLFLTSIYNYLLFHSLAELFGIAVACGIFMLGWNSRRIVGSDYLLFLGIAYLFVAFMDTVHTLAYTGMNVFPQYGTNLPTQLWISTRYMESVSLLIAPVFIRRRLGTAFAFLVYSAVVFVLLVAIFRGVFPVCFAEGTGLTAFKKASEYVICGILVGAFAALYRKRGMLDRQVFGLLAASICLTIASEISFTLYVDAYGFSNLVGHFLKIISFYLIYKALIEVGLARPYRLLFKNEREQLARQERNLIAVESELSESQDRYKTLLEAANDAIFVADARTGIILEANKRAEELMRMPIEEIVGMHQSQLHPAEEVEHYRDIFARHREAGEAVADDVLVRTRDGRLVPVEISASVTTIGDRKVVLGLFRDISERKRSKDELERNYRAQAILNTLLNLALEDIPLESLLEQTIDIVLSTSWLAVQAKGCIFLRDGRHETLLMKAQKGLDGPVVEACGRIPFGKCLCGRAASAGEVQFADRLDSRHEIMYEDIEPHGHYCVPIKAGQELLGVMCLYVEEGHQRERTEEEFLLSVASALAGIIHRKRVQEDLLKTEEQLRQSQKMEALGRLVGGIAHDFNNLLAVIGGRARRALKNIGSDGSLKHEIDEIVKAENSATSLTRQLLTFGRKQILRPRILNLNEIISDLEMMLRRLISEDITFLTQTEPGLGFVEADSSQIEQIVVNLVLNARDAMPAGGRLAIKTSNVRLGEVHPDGYLAPPGDYVMLEVSDTGIGMDKETMSRIFEPFFTTKNPGEGTGLGLSTVYGIVRQSGGDIRVHSELGRGTTFKIYLPRTDKSVHPEVREERKDAQSTRGTETILLVEDEKSVRELIALELKDLGYNVLEAANGFEALRASQEQPGEIHLVITDIVMPGMDGPEAFKLLAQERPGIKVLYCSGYAEKKILQKGVLDQSRIFLQKPFTAESLGHKVRDVLDTA